MHQVHVRLKGGKGYRIEIGAGILDALGDKARASLSGYARRVAVISNQRVFDLYGTRAMASLRKADFESEHWLMGDGERYKSLGVAERALKFLSERKLERGDTVVALGGGVVGDLAGFAAAIYLRGIAFVQVPTTLLAQVDASVGGKTGVNTSAGKNLIGAFHQPRLVLIDTDTLKTLPAREMQAGLFEAFKQGAVGSRAMLNQTTRFLARRQSSAEWAGDELATLVAAQCSYKARIVAGDEREGLDRTDGRSRRVLNFGHTIAHALETATHYKRLLHGEAVGYGMLAAGEISVRVGLLEAAEFERLQKAIRLVGPLPQITVDEEEILNLLMGDKKSVGGHLKWVLLERLGRARIVDNREIPSNIVRASLRAALRFSAAN